MEFWDRQTYTETVSVSVCVAYISLSLPGKATDLADSGSQIQVLPARLFAY